MKAVFKNPKEGIKAKAHRKENHFMYEVSAIVPSKEAGEYKQPVTLRIYGSATGAANYCCIWVHGEVKEGGNHFEGKHMSVSGSDRATGYGYHRPSQAAEGAINAAGIKLSEAIGGRGDEAIREAVKAIAAALGHPKALIFKANP